MKLTWFQCRSEAGIFGMDVNGRCNRLLDGQAKKKPVLSRAFSFCCAAYWWRRGELNPRPQVLYRQIYILSQVVRFNRLPANRQADKRRVTYFLACRKVTLRYASSCE